MNTIKTRHRAALQPQVSATVRFAAAAAVAALLALAWIGAELASHQAVQTAKAALSASPAQAARPAVEIAGRREPVAGKRI